MNEKLAWTDEERTEELRGRVRELEYNCAELENGCAGDLNGDGGWNVLDIVTLANCVLAQNCAG